MPEIIPASFRPFVHLESGAGKRASVDAIRRPPQAQNKAKLRLIRFLAKALVLLCCYLSLLGIKRKKVHIEHQGWCLQADSGRRFIPSLVSSVIFIFYRSSYCTSSDPSALLLMETPQKNSLSIPGPFKEPLLPNRLQRRDDLGKAP